jgi:dTDP-4-dehydrorhamnose 3,5-epimerase
VKVEPLALAGAFRISHPVHADERGSFRRLFSREDFATHHLPDCTVQVSMATNPVAGTLRGMHFQREPHGEAKLISVATGRIYDVLVDLRPGSATFGRWHGEDLSGDAGTALLAPAGFAHGYLTLTPDARVIYQMDAPYVPEAATGVRWDDPALAITWPMRPGLIGAKDVALPMLAGLVL